MQSTCPDRQLVAEALSAIAFEAGDLLRKLQGGAEVHLKQDGSPTSGADLAAEDLILRRLREAWPRIPVIAEETTSTAAAGRLFFLADPLDGTKDYVEGGSEYSVNLALIADGRPVAGVVLAPALGRVWQAGGAAREARFDPVDRGAPPLWRPTRTRAAPQRGAVALVSTRHGDVQSEAALATLVEPVRRAASSAVKFGLVASGEADLYVRCGRTMEWDTAAGDAIVTLAGGAVIGPDGAPLTYGHRERSYINGVFAALGDPNLARHVSLPRTHTPGLR